MRDQNEVWQNDLYLQEEMLLDRAVEILGESDALEAYKYLLTEKEKIKSPSSQLYNYLYCLSAVAGMKEDALAWLKEAIEEKGFWYRPEVFDDSDLESLRSEAIFQKCRKLSEERFLRESAKAETICTWRSVKSRKLALVLHGNQQNISMCRARWDGMSDQGYQVEYVQSGIVDSCNLYRWDEEAPIRLDKVIEEIQWDKYDSRVLCGFSAGCNEILKSIKCAKIKCEGIVLVSPWIPVIETGMDELLEFMKDNSIWIEVICGKKDDDCMPLAERFAEAAKEKGVQVSTRWIDGLGHQYPNCLIYQEFTKFR